MKTKIFRKIKIVQMYGRASLLLALLLCPIVLSAQNGVMVSNLVVNSGTVTFNVSWNKNTMPVALWSDTVWVFVDYNNNGMMTRLPLLPGATLTTTSPGGKVIEETGNNKGVWVAGNARSAGSFSATVKLFTATATATGVCAYATNYPPVAEYIAAQTIKFTGTPPYDLVLNTGSDQACGNYNLLPGQTLQSFTDQTGAPGTFTCIPPAAPINPSSNSRCGSGTVTFSASVPSGITIDWYDALSDGAIVSGGSGVMSFSPTLTKTTTYYAQARNTTLTCVPSTRLSVTGTVNQYGADGSAPGPCGCSAELAACDGTCRADCPTTGHVCGISQYALADTMRYYMKKDAEQACADMGPAWRLPKTAECLCMCSHLRTIPTIYKDYRVMVEETTNTEGYGSCVLLTNCTFERNAVGLRVVCVR